MKRLVLATLALACLSTAAFASGPNSFECVRPDGTVVCTVNAPTGDPSVTCNHDCPDCNLTCKARQVVIQEGNELIINPGASPAVPHGQTGQGGVETKRYCQEQHQQCVDRCRSNRNDRTQDDLDACISSCDSTLSGCGTKPTPN
ncbi:MAG: hypothetical protein HQL37_11150 [Alphaproteobacteria bacterium]|nr:hypothetical protein [Desulfovibrionaceae bacterium]MBF0514418.1 hypothetical protein [Desulfovibrionaceae bacterium]MBF0562555.1 hypothetical protein [Alphaproteobacteria bacterium]